MQQETIFYSANSEQDAAKQARKQKRRKFVLAAEVLYLLLIALVFYVLIGRENAVKQMDALDFQGAVTTFSRIPLGETLFPKDSAYIHAGQLVVEHRYDEASAAFHRLLTEPAAKAAIAETLYQKGVYSMTSGDYAAAALTFKDLGDYKDAVEQEKEARLQSAVKLTADGRYDEAISVLLQLEREKYDPASAAIYQAYLAMAESYAKDGKYADAFETCLKGEKYGDISAQLADYRDGAYQEATALYADGDNVKSKRLFLKLEDYERSKDYLLLIKIRSNTYSSLFLTNEELKRSKSLAELEDGATVIMEYNDTAIAFLEGSWTGLNCYLTVDAEGYMDYNLPYYDYGDYYVIENGIMQVYPEKDVTAMKPFFRYTILTQNTIQIYAYKDGTTYTLFRD